MGKVEFTPYYDEGKEQGYLEFITYKEDEQKFNDLLNEMREAINVYDLEYPKGIVRKRLFFKEIMKVVEEHKDEIIKNLVDDHKEEFFDHVLLSFPKSRRNLIALAKKGKMIKDGEFVPYDEETGILNRWDYVDGEYVHVDKKGRNVEEDGNVKEDKNV